MIFLLPCAFISAELSAAFPDKGGIYNWVKLAFGKQWGMVAIWLQWINTMVWYPTMLTFIVGSLAYLIDPELARNKLYLVASALTIFWILTAINLKGIRVSALVNNILALAGMALPLFLLILFGLIWWLKGNRLQIEFHATALIPNLSSSTSWVSLISIMASFLGIELSSVHINDIQNPQRNFPKAVLFASVFILFTMIFAPLSIAIVLPREEIDLVSGVMQVFVNFLEAFNLKGGIPVIIVLIAFGSIGTMINWVISPAKGLYHAAENGFLPPIFLRKNRAEVPSTILLTQAGVVSLFSIFFLFTPNINGYFWFLTALSTELYMIMYVLMFCAALRLRPKSTFKIPLRGLVCLLGLAGALLTIIISFFPPIGIHTGTPLRYLLTILFANGITLAPLIFFFLYAKRGRLVAKDPQ